MTKALIDILIDDSNIQALIGQKTQANTSEYKVYPLVVTQGEKPPYLVVKTTSRPPVECKSQRPSAFTPTAQVICYDPVYEDVLAIEAAVIDALSGKSGSFNGINVTYIRYVDSTEEWIQNTDGQGLYVRIPTFEAQENASYPT